MRHPWQHPTQPCLDATDMKEKPKMSQPRTAQHTPGPWKLVYEAGKNNQPAIVKGNKGIASVLGYFDGARWDCEANARLIAAAPALLKAVKEMAKDFHAACGTTNMEKCPHSLCLENSRLIATAEGRGA